MENMEKQMIGEVELYKLRAFLREDKRDWNEREANTPQNILEKLHPKDFASRVEERDMIQDERFIWKRN